MRIASIRNLKETWAVRLQYVGVVIEEDDYGPLRDYISPEKIPAPAPDMPGGFFERPQLLLKDGLPTHLYTTCGINVNGGKRTCCYLFKMEGASK